MGAGTAVVVLLILLVLAFIGYLAWKAACDIPILSWFLCSEHGAGSPCSAPSGTAWPFSGCNITAGICCGPPGQGVCSTQCGMEGQPCYQPSGTIWPASGCNISAGICCGPPGQAVCSTQCGMAGQPCYTESGTSWPFSGCNISAGLCCNGKCSTGFTC